MRLLFAVLRMAAVVAGATAVIVTLEASVGAGDFQFFDFFGYFTIQGNLICVVVFLLAAIAGFTGRAQGPWLIWARAAATTYIAIVGVVYNTLLSAANVGALVPWANTTLHVVIPLYAVLDWVLFGDRGPLPWRRVWLVLIYPLVWVGATLARQVIEAHPFVPYPFLDVARLGAGVVALYVLGIAVAFVAFGLLTWWASRSRVLRP